MRVPARVPSHGTTSKDIGISVAIRRSAAQERGGSWPGAKAVSGGQSHKGTSGDDVELREVGLKGHDSLLCCTERPGDVASGAVR